jgi:hypothetical protein
MYKLTLSVDEGVATRAKQFAERQGTSVSALVERYLDELTRSRREELAAAPRTARLAGLLAPGKADVKDHRRHLERKYR